MHLKVKEWRKKLNKKILLVLRVNELMNLIFFFINRRNTFNNTHHYRPQPQQASVIMPVVPLASSTSHQGESNEEGNTTNEGSHSNMLIHSDPSSSTDEGRNNGFDGQRGVGNNVLIPDSEQRNTIGNRRSIMRPQSSRYAQNHQQHCHQHHKATSLGTAPPMIMKDPPSTVHFQDSTTIVHSYDPRRASTAPSLFSELVELRKSFTSGHDQNQQINSNGNNNYYYGADVSTTKPNLVLDSQSRTYSVLSEQSSEFSCMNRELMDEAYTKYESFTPFKTPMQSKHLMTSRATTTQESRRSVHAQHQQQHHMQQLTSMQNLDAVASSFLPAGTVEGNVQRNSSFIGRSISPSRSLMFRKQQLTTSSENSNNNIPSEMRISKVQLLPAREKSPFVMMKIKNSEHQYHQQSLSATPTGRSCSMQHHQHHQEIVNKHLQQCQSNEVCVPPPSSPVLSKASNSSLVQALSNVSFNLSADGSVDSVLLKSVGDHTSDTAVVADIASHLDVTCYNDQIGDENQPGVCGDEALLENPEAPQDSGADQNQQRSGEDLSDKNYGGLDKLDDITVDDNVNSNAQEHYPLEDSQEADDEDKEVFAKLEKDNIEMIDSAPSASNKITTGEDKENSSSSKMIPSSSESLNDSIASIIVDPPLPEKEEDKLAKQTETDALFSGTDSINTNTMTTTNENQSTGDTKTNLGCNAINEDPIQGNLPNKSSSKDVKKDHDRLEGDPSNESLPVTSPIIFEDLTDGLALDLELDSEIMKAFGNIDDFILSDEDDDDLDFDFDDENENDHL